MKLYSGKRIGQSGQELGTAVSFSLFLHVVFFLAAVVIVFTVKPRMYVPPVYSVKLVSQPGEPSIQAPPVEQKQPPKQTVPPKPKERKAAEKPRPARKSNALPDLSAAKPKRELLEQEKLDEPEVPVPQETPSQEQTAGVGMPTPSQDFKFGWYLGLVRSKISQHWNPPPDSREARARVIFSINRSGWVGEVALDQEKSLGTFLFKQAAVRAIKASNPFPRLPEQFPGQTLEFTVDLMAIE